MVLIELTRAALRGTCKCGALIKQQLLLPSYNACQQNRIRFLREYLQTQQKKEFRQKNR